jgi:glutaredoxin
MNDLAGYRRIALYAALVLALALLFLDRTAAWLHRPDPDSRAVVIYTTVWCPNCKQLRVWLDEHRIPYTDYDVERSFNGGMGFWALRGRGVPVAVVGADIIHGLDVGKMRESLRRLGYEIGTPSQGKAFGREPAATGGVSRL